MARLGWPAAVATVATALFAILVVWPTPLLSSELAPFHTLSTYERVPWWHEAEDDASAPQLDGRVAVITGGSSGIGKALAEALVRRGAAVVITSRRLARAQAAADDIRTRVSEAAAARLEPMRLDLGSLDDVSRFASDVLARHAAVDYFSMNAGQGGLPDIVLPPVLREMLMPLLRHKLWRGPWVSPNGFEALYAANYLGHFLLLQLLLPAVKRAGTGAGIVASSSNLHWLHDADLEVLLPAAQRHSNQGRGLGRMLTQYGNTKFLQVLTCFELQRRLAAEGLGDQITVTPVTPGLVSTKIFDQVNRESPPSALIATLSPAQPPDLGAWTSLHALLSPRHRGSTGVFLQPYWGPKHRGTPLLGGASYVMFWETLQKLSWGLHRWLPHPDAHNRSFATLLWEESLEAVAPWLNRRREGEKNEI